MIENAIIANKDVAKPTKGERGLYALLTMLVRTEKYGFCYKRYKVPPCLSEDVQGTEHSLIPCPVVVYMKSSSSTGVSSVIQMIR